MNHTRGPWISYADTPSADPQWHIVTAANHWRVLANVHIEPGNEMDLANARLIAAAPDLLDALQMAKHIVYADGTREQFAKICAAIEKATGESA